MWTTRGIVRCSDWQRVLGPLRKIRHTCSWPPTASLMSGEEVSKLQRMYDKSKSVFQKNKRATPDEIEELKSLLKDIPLEELGLTPPPMMEEDASIISNVIQRLKLLDKRGVKRPSITYLHVFEDSDVSIGIFCLPATATIPLHNHPGMTVLSRVLYGQMFVQSFDWYEQQINGRSTCNQAKLVVSKIQTPADGPLALFPCAGGNIHSFTALTPCAVLDLLTPPYDTKHGRDCSYYYVAGHNTKETGVVQLEEYEPPDDFHVGRGDYQGVHITNSTRSRYS